MQAIPIPRRRPTHDATSTSPHPSPPYRNPTDPAATTAANRRHLDTATPALTRPHPAASPPPTSPLQSPPTPTPPRPRHSCPHPAASAPHLLPHFPGLHPSYYIVAACTFIIYIILHE